MSLIGQRSAESSAAVRRARANRAAGRGGTTTTAARAVRTSFKGTTTEMNGHVFECYDEQSDRRLYAKMLEALEAHVKKVLKFPEDLAPLFAETMEAPALVKPAEPEQDAGRFAETIYLERMKQFWRPESELLGNMATMHAVI